MNILNYEMVEAIAVQGVFWQLKNLDYLLRQHFAGDDTAVFYIELLYVNVIYEKPVVLS